MGVIGEKGHMGDNGLHKPILFIINGLFELNFIQKLNCFLKSIVYTKTFKTNAGKYRYNVT